MKENCPPQEQGKAMLQRSLLPENKSRNCSTSPGEFAVSVLKQSKFLTL